MTKIKSDRYLQKYKGYLTYPPERILNGVLLDYYYEYNFNVKYGEEDIFTPYVKKDLSELIEKYGGIVEKVQVLRTRGKEKLFGIPVEIRKIKNKSVLEGLRIRLTSDNKDGLIQTIEFIKEKMSEYGIKPKECVWQKVDKNIKEDTSKEVLEESEISKIPDCPDCGNSEFDTLNTPKGVRFQCQKCKEIFEYVGRM